ncbi:MAG: dTDP-4-dehydrorhamnose reductase [Flavobacteriaceae bacterium]
MKRILVTGANGQLGNCLKDLSKKEKDLDFVFTDKETLDITNPALVKTFFEENTFDYCINTAAYTHVDKAEREAEQAFRVNAEGVKHLSEACAQNQVTLLHISTDYVFDGTKQTPYTEDDEPHPINVYGASKLKGERYIKEICEKYFIVRTSWLYSQYGHNFYKSITKLAEERETLTITTEQTGCPTNANDLAKVLLEIVESENKAFGIYHYSNEGETTWFGFAKAIVEFSGLSNQVKVVETDYYPTFAKRPVYSLLDTKKIKNCKNVNNEAWQRSLKKLLEKQKN